MSIEPPWEEIPPESNSSMEKENLSAIPVTQAQQKAMLQLVNGLQDQVRKLELRMAKLESGKPGSAYPEGTLQTGKHAGKTRDWVVENAPDYVVYLKEMGYIDKWGFSEEQIEKALASPKLEALQRARK